MERKLYTRVGPLNIVNNSLMLEQKTFNSIKDIANASNSGKYKTHLDFNRNNMNKYTLKIYEVHSGYIIWTVP